MPLRTPVRLLPRLLITPAALALVACGGAEADTDALPVTTPTSSVTTETAQASLSAADIRQLSPEQMVARMANDLSTISEQISDPRDAGELESDLMRLEEVGTDYRTLALRIEREIENGDETYIAALEAGRADLASARDALMSRRDALIAAYPDMEQAVTEGFDKFDFGLLQGRSAARSDG